MNSNTKIMQEIVNIMEKNSISLQELTNYISLKEKKNSLNQILSNARTMSWGDEAIEVDMLEAEILSLSTSISSPIE